MENKKIETFLEKVPKEFHKDIDTGMVKEGREVISISSSRKFFRILGRDINNNENNENGSWWIGESDYTNLIERCKKNKSLQLVDLFRTKLGLKDDWNSKDNVIVMNIPDGVTIDVLKGKGKPQKQIYIENEHDPNLKYKKLSIKTEILMAGMQQYFFRMDDIKDIVKTKVDIDI